VNIPQNMLRCVSFIVVAFSLAVPGKAMAGSKIGACEIFPPNNIWNAPVDTLPVDPNSAAYIQSIGQDSKGHADFGSKWEGKPIGIPITVASANTKKVPVTFKIADESDSGPYPIPHNALIEGGANAPNDSDRHVIVVDEGSCMLYELFAATYQSDGSWKAYAGAVFDLKSNNLRKARWTSADAAGLPILPGLVRYDEVQSGQITHALRFTAKITRNTYVWPARHYASKRTEANYPPMGQRFRLKANYDITGYSPEVQIILKALKKYGMILADNGGNLFISGTPDERWDNDTLHELTRLRGQDFEAVDVSSLMVNLNSAEAKKP